PAPLCIRNLSSLPRTTERRYIYQTTSLPEIVYQYHYGEGERPHAAIPPVPRHDWPTPRLPRSQCTIPTATKPIRRLASSPATPRRLHAGPPTATTTRYATPATKRHRLPNRNPDCQSPARPRTSRLPRMRPAILDKYCVRDGWHDACLGTRSLSLSLPGVHSLLDEFPQGCHA
ncbi:hypothetical protein J1614_006368, partial [Plenodomus biglobosus]